MGKFSTLLRATGLAVTVAMPATAQDASTVMATVNGTDITIGHMIALQDRLPDQYKQLDDKVLFDGILDQLIQQTAMSQEMAKNLSKKTELRQENELRAFLAAELLEEVGTADVDPEKIQALYAERYDGQVEPEVEFNASHILVETKELADELIVMLNDGADFAELAKEESTGPSGPGGGSLGWFGKGAMVPAFEEAVVGLEDGGVSEPVQTQFGWHVVKRNESRIKDAPKLDAVRDELERELRAAAIEEEISRITNAATVERQVIEVDPALIRDVGLLSK